MTSAAKSTHGHAAAGATKIYRVWSAMIRRTTNKNAADYPRYGGKGIAVCERWRSFENFLSDMGEPPAGFSIDRIDSKGNYEPTNCRWIPLAEQARNKSDNVIVTVDGESMVAKEAARRFGIPYKTLLYRLKAGWDCRRALTEPVR